MELLPGGLHVARKTDREKSGKDVIGRALYRISEDCRTHMWFNGVFPSVPECSRVFPSDF